MNKRGAIAGGPKPHSHCVRRRTSTPSARTHMDVNTRRRTSMCGNVRHRKSPYVDARHCSMLKLYATYHYLLRRRRNATTDGDATYDDAVYVIAAVKIDHNVAILVLSPTLLQ